jgi:hypothetical protein
VERSWLPFLKYFDDLEVVKAMEAEQRGNPYSLKPSPENSKQL